ncbi:MAG: HyaD/HybD family hydrogenase maturation endopeptidase [Desulfobacterales bacterium]
MTESQVVILGIGNLLFSDEGFGIRVIERLDAEYIFPDNVLVVDGGVLGIKLLGVMADADHLIVVDAVKNRQAPGTYYRLEQEQLPGRILMKNSLHQTDFLETLTLCQALDKVPETVVLGVEPEDIQTFGIELTETLNGRVDGMMERVLRELDRLGVSYEKRSH